MILLLNMRKGKSSNKITRKESNLNENKRKELVKKQNKLIIKHQIL